MDFKFRFNDGQPPPNRPHSSSFTYFTEQAIRAGYSNNNFSRPHGLFRNPNDMREVVVRELEKERIREEIIAGEIARRRELEAEVRRELMMEKEMALRRSDGFPFVSHRIEPRGLPIVHQLGSRSFEERIVMSLEERLGQRQPSRGFDLVPFQPQTEPRITEIKPVPEINKDKVILLLYHGDLKQDLSKFGSLKNLSRELGKPNTNIIGAKRKAILPPAADTGELALVGSKKQPKEEWSCAICQVSATSEHALHEHLEGKKHKSKEAAIMTQKMGKNFGIGVIPKKTPAPIEPVETSYRPNSVQIIEKKKSPTLKKKKPSLHIKKHTVSKTGDGKIEENRKNKFKFWCEMCQAGAFSEKVMNIHRGGKKHAQNLEFKLNGGGASTTPMEKKQSEEDTVEEETTNIKVSQEVGQEEMKGASKEGNEVEKEAHVESQEVANAASI